VATGIPVNEAKNGWLKHFCRILGVLGLMGGIALVAFAPDGALLGAAVGCIAVLLLVVNEAQLARQKAAERWVVDTGGGFRWLGGLTEVEVRDSQVVAVRIKRTSKFSSGVFQGIVRQFEVWTADREKPICMTNRIVGDNEDPLSALIVRVTEDLKQRTAAGLASGATLEGDGWRLVDMQLLVARGRITETLPFAEVDKVAVFDGKICLWRRGQDEPAAKISPDSKNAAVLASLLSQWIEHQRETSAAAPKAVSGGSEMGRLLFERHRNEGFWLGIVSGVICGAIGAGMLFDRKAVWLGVVLLVAAAAAALLGVVYGRCCFHCYELGLTRRRGRKVFRLLYEEIEAFTYAATPMFYKGAYAGTQLTLAFQAPRGTIRYSAKVQNADADLDELRDHIAKMIAARMLCELRAGRAVPWTSDLALLPQGLQFRRSKMLGLASGPIEILPYGEIQAVDLNAKEGLFHLYSKAEAKPVLSKPVGSANFYPGYFAVMTLQSS